MKSLPIALAATGLAACGTTNSSNLLTHGMSAEMNVSTDGSGTSTVSVALFNGQPLQLIFVDLEGGDTLVATANGGTSMTLGKTQLGNIINYSATFGTGNANDAFVIDLRRTVDAGAPSSTVTLPDPFTVTPPPANGSRASAYTIAYAPSGSNDTMTYQATGGCITEYNGPTSADNGTIIIPANTLQLVSNPTSTSCTVTVKVIRVRAGTLDSHFGYGGSIAGQQVRSTTFTSTP